MSELPVKDIISNVRVHEVWLLFYSINYRGLCLNKVDVSSESLWFWGVHLEYLSGLNVLTQTSAACARIWYKENWNRRTLYTLSR